MTSFNFWTRVGAMDLVPLDAFSGTWFMMSTYEHLQNEVIIEVTHCKMLVMIE